MRVESALREAILAVPAFQEARASLLAGRRAVFSSDERSWPLLALFAADALPGPLVIVCPDETIAASCRAFLADTVGRSPLAFPALDALPGESGSPSAAVCGARHRVQEELESAGDAADGPVVIATAAALAAPVPGPELRTPSLTVRPGDECEPARLAERLTALGYERVALISDRGQFSIRGGIIDVFSSSAESPVRILLDGDEATELRRFDIADQRSRGRARELTAHSARWFDLTDRAKELISGRLAGLHGLADEEELESLADGIWFPGIEKFAACLSPGFHALLSGSRAELVVFDVEACANLVGELAADLSEPHAGPDASGLFAAPEEFASLADGAVLNVLGPAAPDHSAAVTDVAVERPDVAGPGAAALISELLSRKISVFLLAEDRRQLDSCNALIRDAGLGDGVRTGLARLPHSLVLPTGDLALLSATDLFPSRLTRPSVRYAPRLAGAEPVGSIQDLKVGDAIVHVDHGIGIYLGLEEEDAGGVRRESMVIQYADGDKLYLSQDQVDAIHRFAGSEGAPPQLNRLGSPYWGRLKSRVRSSLRDMAAELLALYASREAVKRPPFGPDTAWQKELEDAFPYRETVDQLTSIEDVKRDMEAEHPMDRLICGDVGYGKTEVALRAAFKCVMEGRQVLILVPTTILAQQHFVTFRERFAAYPISVSMISRFRSRKEQKEVLDGFAAGTVDVLIGTHRLISGDLRTKELGLLIIDEEQRFGVAHKEFLKSLQREVDVLTLTATPIPRTMQMAVSGVREMSLINTPPEQRRPVSTYISPFDAGLLASALNRELDRGGQSFVIHNRIASIGTFAGYVARLVPSARISVAHGRMDEGDLESVMLEFIDGGSDVLVCTSIIESGIDLPNVNTMVVNHAERLGLASLYQLRGRIGRSDRRAFAYLFYPSRERLTEDAEERLRAIADHSDLGSGFRIAMRDLEIRGAGNLLGAEQSGHMAALGFDLYCQMLRETVAELRGKALPEPLRVKSDLPVDAYLPADYIEAETQRMSVYRRVAFARKESEISSLKKETIDLFGPLPPQAVAFFDVASLRVSLAGVGGSSLSVSRRGAVKMVLPLDAGATVHLMERFGDDLRYNIPASELRLTLREERGEALLRCLGDIITSVQEYEGVI